jgi:hypothetical protein
VGYGKLFVWVPDDKIGTVADASGGFYGD